jgi:hypothetical protein
MGGKPRVTLADAVRATVQGMIDGVIATAAADGRVELARRERFATIEPAGDHVRVVFEHGDVLPDPGGVLRERRYAEVRSRADLLDRGLRTLFAAALYDDDTLGFRRRRGRE